MSLLWRACRSGSRAYVAAEAAERAEQRIGPTSLCLAHCFFCVLQSGAGSEPYMFRQNL